MLGRFAPGVCTQVTTVVNQQQNRNMATLKHISMRLKSVKNIQKITQSMKMVSAAKYTRAERELRAARPYGEGSVQFYEKAEMQRNMNKIKQLAKTYMIQRNKVKRLNEKERKRNKKIAVLNVILENFKKTNKLTLKSS